MLILLETMAEERRTATAPELLEPLMARLAGGDQEALAELYHRTRTSVYGLALSVPSPGYTAGLAADHRPQPRPDEAAGAGQDPGHGSGGLGTAGSGEPDGDGGGPAGAGRRPHCAGG